MKILTLATQNKGYLPVLKILCNKNKHKLIVIEYNKKWKGFSWRMLKTLKKLEKIEKKNPNELIMIIDAYDVLIIANHDEIVKKFNHFNCDVLFSASCRLTGQPNISLVYQDLLYTRNQYYFETNTESVLNAGSLMGYVKYIRLIFNRMYERYKKTLHNDDQINLNNIYIEDINYRIDKYSSVFWIWECTTIYEMLHIVLFGYAPDTSDDFTNDIIYTKNRIKFKKTKPCVVHGIANRDMDKLCQKNNIKQSVIDTLFKKNTTQSDIKMMIMFVKIIIMIFIFTIIIIKCNSR